MRARLLAIALTTIGVVTTFASTGASAQGTPLFAVLNGVNECNGTAVPNPLTCRVGDTDGYGSATILFPSTTQVCFGIAVDNVGNVTAAHIHTGSAGVNGGIIVNLSPPPGLGNPRAWAGCVAAPAGIISAIKANPTAFYVNVHTTGAPAPAFPNGAIRGQLF